MQQSGLFWHVHHDVLVERCYSHDERAEYIRARKPSDEQELRLRLFQPAKGQLPQEMAEARKVYDEAEKARDKARKAYNGAWKAYNEAGKAYNKARGWNYLKRWTAAWKARDKARKAFNKAGKAYDEAGKASNKAWKAYDEAGKAYDEALFNHKDEIEALHAQECLNCPWDGETIFPVA